MFSNIFNKIDSSDYKRLIELSIVVLFLLIILLISYILYKRMTKDL
jgi:predicted permease